MPKILEPSSKVEYFNQGKWLQGVVHGVVTHEDPETNIITAIYYLIDTGNDARVDEYPYDVKDREVNKRLNALTADGKVPVQAALAQILKQPDLPASKMQVDTVRQPEQVQVPQIFVREINTKQAD